MKKFIATLCIVGSTIALGACANDGNGYVDTAPPYTQERTASNERNAAPAKTYEPAERTFTRAQAK